MKKLVDMERTPTELKDLEKSGPELAQPAYPWGLQLNLDDDSLNKLGITRLPQVDDRVEIRAIAKVQSVSQNKTSRDEENRRVELQICKMSVSRAAPESAEEAVGEGIDEADDDTGY